MFALKNLWANRLLLLCTLAFTACTKASDATPIVIPITPSATASVSVPPDRTAYRASEPNSEGEFLRCEGSQSLDLSDPTLLGLCVAGFPNLDGAQPGEVRTYRIDDQNMVVVVTQDGMADDSLAAQETRIDILKQGDTWTILWVGQRWKCRPNRGHEDWGTDLCI